MTEKAAGQELCPSAPAAPGAQLIGVIEPDGRVVNLITPLAIDAAFVEEAEAGGPVEMRFRFSSPCVQGGCGHWTGEQCGLIGKLHREIPHASAGQSPLPPCAIRARCRWWQQRGRDACAICAVVVTGTEGSPGGYLGPT